MNSEIVKVIHFFGNQKALASALSLSDYAVSRWVKNGYIPSNRIWEIKQIIGERRTFLGETITIENLLREAYEKQHQSNLDTQDSDNYFKDDKSNTIEKI